MNISNIPSLEVKIDHKNWREALQDSFAYLSYASAGEVVCIVGPSRAGKSRLIQSLQSLLVGSSEDCGTGIKHTLSITATNAGPNGSFSTKSFILRLLEKLEHPMYSLHDGNPEMEKTARRIERITEHRLRQAAEQGLRYRQVKYLFIDEAQHILYSNTRSGASEAILDSWKCLAQETGVVLVLVGAYPLLQCIQNSPHLLGRKHQVHFPRYQYCESDLHQFAAILAKYEELLSSHCKESELVSNLEFMFKSSLGCIGLLKAWLTRALALASITEQKISLSLLKRSKLSSEELKNIEREIIDGETILGSTDERLLMKKIAVQRKKQSSKPFQAKPKRRTKANRGGQKDV